jgi:two-component sensor histidine kinase
MKELDHRVKNIFATIQAMAAQTLREAPDIDVAFSTYSARLIALDSVHGVSQGATWQTAGLAELVSASIGPFQDAERSHFEVEGPHVSLQPKLTLTLALISHELCTDAVKCGVLSVAAGTVELQWQILQGPESVLQITWAEKGDHGSRLRSDRGLVAD